MYEEDKVMQYEIVGKTVPAVEITLDRGESMYIYPEWWDDMADRRN